MFDKEFEDKLKESVNTPRNHDFDEGAWAGLEQQLEILSAATGTSLGAGLKGAAMWGVKSWMATAAAIVLLGTTVYFYSQWQQTKQEVADLKTSTEQLNTEEQRNESALPSIDLPNVDTEFAASEAELDKKTLPGVVEYAQAEQKNAAPDFVSTQNQSSQPNQEVPLVMTDDSNESVIPSDEPKSFMNIAVEASAPVYWDMQANMGEYYSLPRLLPFLKHEEKSKIRHPLRLAVEASLSTTNRDSLQPFKGKAIGLRPEFWLSHKFAVYAGIIEQSSEAVFTKENIGPLESRFPPLPGFFREDQLTDAVFSTKEILVPMGIKYAPFHNHWIKVFTGIGVTLQKDREKDIKLTYFHQDNFPQWGPREWSYDIEVRREAGKLRLSQATIEAGARLQVSRHAELELAYTYLQDISGDSSLFVRDRGTKISSALIFSF
jgi:hypothetical protein